MQCTCGAQLPDDARFCHRCGKPQFEDDIARLRDEKIREVQAALPVSTPSKVRIDFSNRRGVFGSIAVSMLTLFVFTASSVLVPFAASLLMLPLFCFAG